MANDLKYDYDVFISYSHSDENWVTTILLPRLEKAGLKVCIDFRDFEPGKAALYNMRDASKRSHHSLLIMTPRWVNAEWTLYESILARTEDPAGLQKRTIPLLLENCNIPEDISILTYVNFTRPDRIELAWHQLLTALSNVSATQIPQARPLVAEMPAMNGAAVESLPVEVQGEPIANEVMAAEDLAHRPGVPLAIQPGSFTAAASSASGFLGTSLTDWLTFLQGPAPPVFDSSTAFNAEWKRLIRLCALVLLLLSVITIAFSLGTGQPGEKWHLLATRTRDLMLVLGVGAVVAVLYAFMLAPLLRIRITFIQTLFALLMLGLPWLPLILFVQALGMVWTNGLVVGLFLSALALVPLYNFCKGVAIIAGCRPRRVMLSLAIPAVLALVVVIANVV